jgi:hypothetical protein
MLILCNHYCSIIIITIIIIIIMEMCTNIIAVRLMDK